MPPQPVDLLIEIDYAPDAAHASLEALEMILAAAALEFSVIVLLCGPAITFVQGPESRRWRQLIDFELARLVTTEPIAQWPDALPVRQIDAAVVEQMRENARNILIL